MIPTAGKSRMDAILFHPETSDAAGDDPGPGEIRSLKDSRPAIESRWWRSSWRPIAAIPTPGFMGRRNGRCGGGSRRSS